MGIEATKITFGDLPALQMMAVVGRYQLPDWSCLTHGFLDKTYWLHLFIVMGMKATKITFGDLPALQMMAVVG